MKNQRLKGMPLLIIENFDDKYKYLKNRPVTLTVFVHGYQGNSFDFQKSKNYLRKYNCNT